MKALPEAIEKALSNSDSFVHSLFQRPESLGALLPYDEYLPPFEMFRQKDGSLGVVYEVTLLEHETMSGDEIVSQVSTLKSWMNWPHNTVLQILFEQSFVSERDPAWKEISEAYPKPHPFAERVFQEKLGAIQTQCRKDSEEAPLQRKLFVSVRYFLSESQQRRWKSHFKDDYEFLSDELGTWTKECQQFQHELLSFEKSVKLPIRRLNANGMLDVLRRFFNPNTYYQRDFASYQPQYSLSDQVIYSSVKMDYSGMEREGQMTRTLSLKMSPSFTYPGGMAYFLKLNFPFRMALHFKFPTSFETKKFLGIKEFLLENTPSAKSRRQKEDLLKVQDQLAREDRVVHMSFHVILDGKREVLDQRARDMMAIFRNDLDCEAIVEEDIGLGLCLNALPLNYSAKTDGSAKRFIRMLRSNAVQLIPIFDSFRGLKKPLQIHLSRERNLARFSLIENLTSNHTVVVGDTGTSKSSIIMDSVLAYKRTDPEPIIFVLDNKANYAMMPHFFDGDLTTFNSDQEMPFSPFRGKFDEDKISFLARLILAGIQMTSPSFQTGSAHLTSISEGLRQAYEKKSQQAGLAFIDGKLVPQPSEESIEINMEDLVSELSILPSMPEFESLGKAVDDLQSLLMPFYDKGIYAKYFKGAKKRKIDKQVRFFVYDLDGLKDPIARALMSMAVFEDIRQTIMQSADSGRRGLMIIEELSVLGRNNASAAEFIKEGAETFRKLGVNMIGLTASARSYFEIPACQAMWEAADNFVITQLSSDNVAFMEKNSELFDEATGQIVRSLRMRLGEYSEFFYINKVKTLKGVLRFRQVPTSRWLSPTNVKDIAAARRALNQFQTPAQALDYLSKTYPKGVEAYETQNQS